MAKDYGMDLSGILEEILGATDKIINAGKAKGETLGEAIGEGIAKGVASKKTDIVNEVLDVKAIKDRIKELQTSAANAAVQMKKVVDKGLNADYGANVARYDGTIKRNQREIEALTNQLKAQGVVVKNNTKSYRELHAALEEIGYVEKKKKTSSPRKNAAAEVKQQTAAEKEHIKSVEESVEATETQAKAAKNTKKAHDDAAVAAKERAKAEQEVSDVGKIQGKILDTVTAKTQKQTDAIKKQEKATRDLAKAQQTVNVKKQSTKTMADFQKLWSKASKNYSAEDFGKRYGHLMESISGDNPTMTIDAAYKELQKKDREYRKQLAAENAKSQLKAVELQAFNSAMSPLMTQISASEKLTQEYAYALEEITAGSLTAAAATERLQEALRGTKQELANIGYHAGDLGSAEHFGNFIGGNRDTGHYGTGVYFAGNKEALKGYNSRDGKPAPIEEVHPSNYNLFKAGTTEQAMELHDALKLIDNDLKTIYQYHGADLDLLKQSIEDGELSGVKDFSGKYLTKHQLSMYRQEADEYKAYLERIAHDDESLRSEVESDITKSINMLGNDDDWLIFDDLVNAEIADRKARALEALNAFNVDDEVIKRVAYDIEHGGFDNLSTAHGSKDALVDKLAKVFINNTREELSDALDEVFKVTSGYSGDLWQFDSASTVFMKRLGYEGVDVRGTELDNTKYGSVIYNLKGEDLARRQEILKLSAATSKEAADQAERQAQAEASIAKSAQETAKAKLTAIQRQAYNYRRPTKNTDALTERANTLSGRLDEVSAIRTEFPELEKACTAAESAVTETLGSLRKLTGGTNDVEASAESAAKAQEKLSQTNEEVAAAADKAEQQIEEQTAALHEQSAAQHKPTTKLTASEYQAAFGGGVLGKFLAGFNIKGQAANDIADIAADAMRGQKMMIEGSQSDDMELLNAGTQLFTESVRKASAEIMNLGSTTTDADDALKDFYNYMRPKKIKYNDADKAEFGGKAEWNSVRKRFNNMLTTSSSGVPIDMIWDEILGLFPGLFDQNMINEHEQLVSVLNMMDKARDAKKNNWKNITPIHGSLEDIQGSVASVFDDMGNAMVKAMHVQTKLIAGEEAIADTAAQTTGELKQQNAERREAVGLDEHLDESYDDDGKVAAQQIIERELSDAIRQLRTAQDNETTLFSLKGVNSGEGLVDEARNFVDKIAEQSNLKLSKFTVKDNIIQAQLYNDELKVVVDQTYRLQQATEEADAALELIGQSFSQNVKALNTNNFDVEGVRAKAIASVDAARASLHGAPYDLSELETAANNITSQDDFKKFQNQLDAAKKSIQAISSSIESPDTMNPLVSMQRNMRKANTELDTMQLNLKKFGNVEGVQKAEQMIDDMRKAIEEFNKAADVTEQRNAYNTYSGLKGQLDAQMKYLNAAKATGSTVEAQSAAVRNESWKVYAQEGYKYTGGKTVDDQIELDRMRDYYKQEEVKAQQSAENIKSVYSEMLRVINQINNLDSKMNDLTFKDKGTGMYAGIIQNLETQKAFLLNDLNSLQDELAKALSIDPTGGQDALSLLFQDARVQAALTIEEIQNIQKAFMQTENVRFSFGAKLAEQIQPVIEKVAHLMKLIESGAITDAGVIRNIAGINTIIGQKSVAFNESGSPVAAMDFMKYINDIAEYIGQLDKAAEAEKKYFENKKQYANIEDYTFAAANSSNVSSAQQKLEEFVNTFAHGKAIITNFTTSANGINKIDFSVLDETTHQFRTFSAEMGQFTNKVSTYETSMRNLTSGTDAAKKALASMSEVMARLSLMQDSGLDVGVHSEQIWQRMKELKDQLAAIGDSKDADSQTLLKNLAAEAQKSIKEIAKLEAQWRKTEQTIDGDQIRNLGSIDQAGNIYQQMYAKIHAAAEGAAISNVEFNKTTNTMTYTLEDANGQVTKMTASMDALTGTIVSQKGAISQADTMWSNFVGSFGGAFKQVKNYVVNLFGLTDIVRYLRTGFAAVKEIDSAMTELKKVTNETEASYQRFLQTASKTAGNIGSTVSDFTAATAEFARLGYSMEESASMAETAIVYKNVADGLDTVEASTESIISTMMAFGIEADNTMSIVDRFNEVGNNFAISSAGIGEALQRSASALYAAGNTIDESIALVTAGNSVIQNPEQVGKINCPST